MDSDWPVFVECHDNNTISLRGESSIQVQLIYSLPFVTK